MVYEGTTELRVLPRDMRGGLTRVLGARTGGLTSCLNARLLRRACCAEEHTIVAQEAAEQLPFGMLTRHCVPRL